MTNRLSDQALLSAAWDTVILTLGGPSADSSQSAKKARDSATAKVPVTILSGFLGAGKTTLLCQLLEEASIEIVAIVNDMASVNFDAALVRSKNAETIELQNGCACCVLSSDLADTLNQIAARKTPPAAIVIEASGVADPTGIAQTVENADNTILDGIITAVDALTIDQRTADPFTNHLFERQLMAAHLIVLTKIQEGEHVVALRETLGRIAPGRAVLISDALDEASTGAAQVLLGAATHGARLPVTTEQHNYNNFRAEVITWSKPVHAATFFNLLDQLTESVYRIKGKVCLVDDTLEIASLHQYEVQATGTHWRVNKFHATRGFGEKGQAKETGELILIGRSGHTGFERLVLDFRNL